MSDVPAPEVPPAAPAPAAPAAPAAPVDNGATPPADSGAPKWDGEFDPERAARLIANLREESKGYKTQLEDVRAKLTQHEQAQMSEAEKVAQRAQTAESELAALRREIAVRDALAEHGLPKDAARFLTGDTPEEISEAAKAFAALAPKPAEPAETPLPPTLPVPGNGSDPAAVGQLTAAQLEGMTPQQIMAAYREGRIRNAGGK